MKHITKYNRVVFSLTAGGALLLALLLFLSGTVQITRAAPNNLFAAPDGTGTVCTQAAPCALQTASEQAADGDTLYLAQGTYTGTGAAVITVTSSITVYGGWDGAPSGLLVRDPALYTSTLDAEYGRRVCYGRASAFSLDGLRLVRGNASGLGRLGGGLYVNQHALRLNNCTFSDNAAYKASLGAGEAYGGAVYLLNPDPTTVISGCLFVDNTAARAPNTPGWGGAVYVGGAAVGGHVRLVGNTFQGNTASTGLEGRGGGMALLGGQRSYDIEDNVFVDNVASSANETSMGGGVYIWYSGQVTVTNNRFSGNIANAGTGEGYGGGMMIDHATVILNSNTFTGNQGACQGFGGGGGIRANGGDVLLEANRFLSNTASLHASAIGGGMWLESGAFALENNVVASNRADQQGAGIWLVGSLPAPATFDLRHSTLADNAGDGLAMGDYATATLTNTLAAGNTAAFRLIGGTACTLTADTTLFWDNPTEVTGTHSLVGDPAFVDPATWDYHLGAGSAAVDAGVDAEVASDIDGDSRPIGAGHDIGADERWAYVYLPLVMRGY